MTTPLRIVVVDDHHLFRSGVIELLRSFDDFAVVGEGSTGADALALVQELAPEVLVLDVEMPGPGARTIVRRIRESGAKTSVVILTMHDDSERLRDLITAGASAYLLKTANRTELAVAVRLAAGADDNVMIAVSRTAYVGSTQLAKTVAQLLTPREGEVLALVAQAKTSRQIGRKLTISEATVKRHLGNIYSKLGASSRVDALRKARANGLLRGKTIEGGDAPS